MKTKTVYLLLLSYSWELSRASFHNNFSSITRHTDLLLEWDHVNATDYPLVIHARILNVTSDHKVNTFEMDISTGLTDDLFIWKDLPSPLPFLSTATYELQVLRQYPGGDGISDLVVVSSTPFAILREDGDGNDNSGWQTRINGTASDPSEGTNSSGHPDSSVAIAAGLVVPLVVGISVSVFLCMQRRRKRTLEERRKERAALVID